jgi:hypothetical protein
MNPRRVLCLAVVLSCCALLLSGCASKGSCRNQAPRNLNRASPPPPVFEETDHSIVGRVTPGRYRVGTIEYVRSPGSTPVVLRKCSEHYHYPIENPQGCRGELPPRGTPGTLPPANDWVEVHAAYSSDPPEVCIDTESTKCCLGETVVVRAFTAKVTAEGSDEPIAEPSGRPLFEWSGSTTGPDKVLNECKPPALWSFRLRCDFTVSLAQLRTFRHPEAARGLQTGTRISRDLKLVRP